MSKPAEQQTSPEHERAAFPEAGHGVDWNSSTAVLDDVVVLRYRPKNASGTSAGT